MPSTYTTNGGIELIANGEQSGTWGDTTNTNLQIVDRLTNGVGAISLSGTTHTLTTSAGVLSDGQYSVLVFGGSPSGTNTVTISPNDAQHVYFVKNSSGQSVVLTQGSGGNVTVADGKSAIVYADGAGAGAEVVDITNTFNYQPLTATLTAIGALAVTDGNIIVGDGSTWVAESGATARTSLGLGTIATQASNNVSITGGTITGITSFASNSVAITGGSITGITDLAVSDGGTGASSFTANNVLLGNGTSSFQTVAPGSSGNVLTSNGTTWSSAAPAVALASNNAFTGANTFYNATGQTFGTATSSEDGIIISGRAGGSSSYRITVVPADLSGNRTITLPDPGSNETLGYQNIPQNSQSASYTLVLSDAGKHILHPSADTTARTFTIPANSSVAFPVGTAVTFINQDSGGDITIAITTDTLRLAGDGSTGSRTLTANGIATAIKVTSTEWIISGVNLA